MGLGAGLVKTMPRPGRGLFVPMRRLSKPPDTGIIGEDVGVGYSTHTSPDQVLLRLSAEGFAV